MTPSYESPRQRYTRRWKALTTDRESYLVKWRDIDEHVFPMAARFLLTDRTKPKQNNKIINSTPAWAVDTSGAGMMGGITSPARPWLRTASGPPSSQPSGSVQGWTHEVDNLLLDVFARSNAYAALFQAYLDLIAFGTTALFVEEDLEDTIRIYHLPIGQYALQNSSRLRVDTVYRELSMTVLQLVERFGEERLSVQTKAMLGNREFDKPVDVLHVVEPNRNYLRGSIARARRAWHSCWLESKADDSTPMLLESGYDEFPVLCPRWNVQGEDVYGVSPGMKALGDCKALQDLEKDKAAYVDRVVAPPMVVPASFANKRVSLLPGDKIVMDGPGGKDQIYPAIQLNPAGFQYVEEMIREHEARIRRTLFADLWRMWAETERAQITATEIEARQQEKMLQLGPIMERLQDELLDPLIDRVFAICVRRGLVPEPPAELQGAELRVEYVSILTQAQKSLGVIALERHAGFVTKLAADTQNTALLDGTEWDRLLGHHANATGVPPDVVVPADRVQAIREQRAAEKQAAQQAALAEQAAATAATLSQADLGGDTALSRLTGVYGGAA